jgi:hypothetical protein
MQIPIEVQACIDEIYSSLTGLPASQLSIDRVVRWLESEGWTDFMIPAWESTDEMCVIDWDTFCNEHANEPAFREYEDADLRDCGPEQRASYLQELIDAKYEDGWETPSVHPVVLKTSKSESFTFGLLSRSAGQGGWTCEHFGAYKSTDDFLVDLIDAGYKRIDKPLSEAELLNAWIL